MSAPLFAGDVLFFQRFLSICGFYAGDLDGIYGPRTGNAEGDCDARCPAIATTEGVFDARSEANIRSPRRDAQRLARRRLGALKADGFDARIFSGPRSYAEQNALFRQGRFGSPGKIVTKARGGQSRRNFGLALDIGLFSGGAYPETEKPYRDAARVAKAAGLEWGGDRQSFPDIPHDQLASAGLTITQARAQFEAGGRA